VEEGSPTVLSAIESSEPEQQEVGLAETVQIVLWLLLTSLQAGGGM